MDTLNSMCHMEQLMCKLTSVLSGSTDYQHRHYQYKQCDGYE
jgi:hypothetical protein